MKEEGEDTMSDLAGDYWDGDTDDLPEVKVPHWTATNQPNPFDEAEARR